MATPGSGNLYVALKIKADAAQAKAALAEVQAGIKGVEQQAVSSNAAQVRSTQSVIAAQNAQMLNYAKFADIAKNADVAVQTLKSGTVTSAALETSVNDLGKALDAGVLTQEEYVAALKLADAAKVKDIAVTEAQTVAVREYALNAKASGEIATAASEILAGNFGRLRRTGAAFANQAGILNKLMSPLGLAIAGTAGAVVLLAMAFEKGQQEDAKFNAAIALTNGYAGVTIGQLRSMAQGMTGAATSVGEAKNALQAVTATGKFAGDQIGLIAKAALDMAHTTGMSVEQAVGEFEKLGESPVEAAVKLNDQYHFLTQSVFEQIRALERQGDADGAAQVAQEALAQSFDRVAQQQEQSLGTLQKMWRELGHAVSTTWDLIEGIGRKKDNSEIFNASKQLLEFYQKGGGVTATANGGFKVGPNIGRYDSANQQLIRDTIANFNKTRDAAEGAAKAADDQANAQRRVAELAHDQTWADNLGKGYSKVADRARAAEIVSTRLLKLITEGGQLPAGVHIAAGAKGGFAGPGFDYLVNKEAGISTAGVPGAARQAAIAAAQAAVKQVEDIYANGQKVIEAQHKARLVNDQAFYDAERGMLTEWELDKVAALEKEKAAATSHVVTQADRIKADQKVAEIDSEIAKVHADATAKRLALDAKEKKSIDDLRRAWESLQAVANKTTGSVDFGKFAKEQATAKAALGAGLTDQHGYQDTIDKLIMEAVEGKGAPKYRGLSARIGGAFADVGRAQNAETAENAYFQQELNRLVGFLNKKKITTEKYYADLEKISLAHNQRLEQIDDAKNLAMLTGLSTSFNQAANSVRSAFGEQSAAYRVAFDIAKTAAIAQSTLAMFQAVAEASKMPWPANLGLMAEAFAQGMAIVADVRAIQLGPSGGAGYSGGGYTGDAPITQAVGVVHGREGVLSAPEVSAIGGEAGFNALRSAIRRGYAGGGFVAPSPGDLGFVPPVLPQARLPSPASMKPAPPVVHVKAVLAMNADEVAHHLINTPAGQKAVVVTVGNNPRAIQGRWSSG